MSGKIIKSTQLQKFKDSEVEFISYLDFDNDPNKFLKIYQQNKLPNKKYLCIVYGDKNVYVDLKNR